MILYKKGLAGLTKAVDKLDWERLKTEDCTWKPESEDVEKTLKSFLSVKELKVAIRRANR